MIDRSFVLAGSAIFTVSNNKGEHYTFKVTKKDDERGAIYFAGFLSGPDNESSYTYLGIVDAESGSVRLTKASRVTEDSTVVKVLRWTLRMLWARAVMPVGYDARHAGKCGRCGRTLTTPESLERGIGPECFQRIAA